MTVPSAVSRSDYVGNGAASNYAYGFRIFAKTDLLVTVRDTNNLETTLVVDVDYTVNNVGSANGSIDLIGSGTHLTAGKLKDQYRLTIRFKTPLVQETDLRNQGSFFAETHEDVFDRLLKISQQQQDELDRSIKLPETVAAAGVDTNLPVPVASKVIGWNEAGDGLRNLDPSEVATLAAIGNYAVDHFDAGTHFTAGVTTTLALGADPGTKNNTQVTFDGVVQHKDTYSLSGTGTVSIVFNDPIPVGVVDVEVFRAGAISPSVPSDLSVTNAKVAENAAIESSKLQFTPSGTGAVARTVQAKLRESDRTPEDFGAVGDDATDDTTALQDALNATPAYGSLYISKNHVITSQLNVVNDYVLIYGPGKIRAADSATGMTLLFSASGRTGVVMKDVEFDANKSGRASGQSVRYNGIEFPSSIDCTLINVTVRNCLGYGGLSATSISASGSGTKRFHAHVCKVLDGGTSAATLPSDGFFVRGDNCGIHECYAENITDTAFVLEGCNYSIISDCSGKNCTALGAISNDTASDCVGSQINGLTGSVNYVGSTGGVVGVACFGAGNIRDAKVSGVAIRLESAATNLGPLMQVRRTSTGRVIGLTIDNPTIDYGGSAGVIAQAILVSDSDDVQINDPYLRVERGTGASAIRFDGACVNGIVTGGYIYGSDNGVLVKGTSEVKVKGVTFKDPVSYAINADDTSTVVESGCTHEGSGASVNRAAGATLKTEFWQAWTPTYSSDIGNAAATFSGGTVTTTLGRFRTVGRKCELALTYSATLNAVTPNYIEASLPPGVTGANDQTWNPASVSNAGTFETGFVRCVGSGGNMRVHRAASVNYGSGAAVEGRFAFGFETA